MANRAQLRILKEQGVKAWNAWCSQAGGIPPDLSEANLNGANLIEADLRGADLGAAHLSRADLRGADLSGANLKGAHLSEALLRDADLRGARLSWADLREADLGAAHLSRADLTGADLREAHLSWADLTGADLCWARFFETILSNVDLSRCENLETIVHRGPSPIDIRTLRRSGPLPLAFLRGVGLPDTLIDYLPSLLGQSIQFYSCFISYASKDDAFARRLHSDLQNNGVRCWFDAEDMKIGAKIRDTLDEAIRTRQKVLLVLSEASIASTWVEGEVEKAFEEERQRGGLVLFPVRLDDAVLTTKAAWAAHLRRTRHIGDFRNWEGHDAYGKALERLLRDLRVEAT
jgi:uncharacterized protein YjbI with pentapeptide repeats